MSKGISEVIATPDRAAAPRHSSKKATGMLVVITLLWGLSFPLMKNWLSAASQCPGGPAVAGLTMIVMRMFLALVILGVFLPRLFLAPSRREYGIGFLLGAINSLGFIFQVVGLAWTSPALSAFVTSLASAWVPLLMFALFRLRVHRLTLMGLILGIGGAAALSFHTTPEDTVPHITFRWGEMLTFLSTWFFALVIVLLDRLGRGVESAHFTVAFLLGNGLPALDIILVLTASRSETAAWLDWTRTMLHHPLILRDLGLLTVLCTVLTFHWFNVYQPRVAASRAALIYLLEPVFAAIFSILWGLDTLGLQLLIGGGLILAGNFLVEIPAWLKNSLQGSKRFS